MNAPPRRVKSAVPLRERAPRQAPPPEPSAPFSRAAGHPDAAYLADYITEPATPTGPSVSVSVRVPPECARETHRYGRGSPTQRSPSASVQAFARRLAAAAGDAGGQGPAAAAASAAAAPPPLLPPVRTSWQGQGPSALPPLVGPPAALASGSAASSLEITPPGRGPLSRIHWAGGGGGGVGGGGNGGVNAGGVGAGGGGFGRGAATAVAAADRKSVV